MVLLSWTKRESSYFRPEINEKFVEHGENSPKILSSICQEGGEIISTLTWPCWTRPKRKEAYFIQEIAQYMPSNGEMVSVLSWPRWTRVTRLRQCWMKEKLLNRWCPGKLSPRKYQILLHISPGHAKQMDSMSALTISSWLVGPNIYHPLVQKKLVHLTCFGKVEVGYIDWNSLCFEAR